MRDKPEISVLVGCNQRRSCPKMVLTNTKSRSVSRDYAWGVSLEAESRRDHSGTQKLGPKGNYSETTPA